jgi:hypothetical protein
MLFLRRVFNVLIIGLLLAENIERVYHLDLKSLLKNPTYSSATVDTSAKKRISDQSIVGTTTITKSFRINLSCKAGFGDPNPNKTCAEISNSLVRAATRIERHVFLPTKVTIEVKYQSFCSAPFSSPLGTPCAAPGNTLGRASPAGMYIFSEKFAADNGLDHKYGYPSALAKQYAPSEFSNTSIDIFASFNSDFNWYFGTGNPTWGKSQTINGGFYNQSMEVSYDFEQVAAHEIIHGLGFLSSFGPWSSLNDTFLPSYIDRNGFGEIIGMLPPWIYVKFLADAKHGVWISSYADAIAASFHEALDRGGTSQWEIYFKNTVGHKLGQALAHPNGLFSTPYALYFWFNKAGKSKFAVLDTRKQFAIGSSISHLESSIYSTTTSFLMSAYATRGVAMKKMIPSSYRHEIGIIILEMLSSMGYIIYL